MSKKRPKFPDVTEAPRPCDGGQAFPMPISNGGYSIITGMTLRDYFAAKVACGLCSNEAFHERVMQWCGLVGYGKSRDECDAIGRKFLAEYSYQFADAMLKARESK